MTILLSVLWLWYIDSDHPSVCHTLCPSRPINDIPEPTNLSVQEAIRKVRTLKSWIESGKQGPAPALPTEDEVNLYRNSKEYQKDLFQLRALKHQPDIEKGE